jgi:hypothetical protein
MTTPVEETSEPSATPQKAQVSPKQHASPDRPVDKYAAARDAKKKQRRRAHRAVLKRSHTNG